MIEIQSLLNDTFQCHFCSLCVVSFETSLWVHSSLWWTWDQSRPYCSWHFSPAAATELVFCCMALRKLFSSRPDIIKWSSRFTHFIEERQRELFQKEWEKSFHGKSFQFPMTEKASLMRAFIHVCKLKCHKRRIPYLLEFKPLLELKLGRIARNFLLNCTMRLLLVVLVVTS